MIHDSPDIRWAVKPHDGYMVDGEEPISVVNAAGEIVCCNTSFYPTAITKARATLIAAAPDLLSALKDCRESCFFDDDDGQIGVSEDVVISSELFDRICASINKAEGRL